MPILISNNKTILEKVKGVTVVFFNPWGFSKSDIESKIQEALCECLIEMDSEIYFYIENIFFGNRSKIALNKLRSIYPKNKIFEINNLQELELFFNQPSI